MGSNGEEVNHVGILHFQDEMGYDPTPPDAQAQDGGLPGAQFGVVKCHGKKKLQFSAFNAGDGQRLDGHGKRLQIRTLDLMELLQLWSWGNRSLAAGKWSIGPRVTLCDCTCLYGTYPSA